MAKHTNNAGTPTRVQKDLTKALEYFHSGQHKQAEKICHRIVKKYSDNVYALQLLGIMAHQDGNLEKAIRYFQKAVAEDPSVPELHNSLGIIFYELGNLKESGNHLQKAVKLKPGYAEAHGNLGSTLMDMGQIDTAQKHYEKALSLNPALAETQYNLGSLLLQKNNIDSAIKYYRKAISLNPEFMDALQSLGCLLITTCQYVEAARIFGRLTSINPESPEARINLATALHKSGKSREAFLEYEKIIEQFPECSSAFYNYAKALNEQGYQEKAITYFKRTITLDPNDSEAYHNLGLVYLQARRISEAVEQITRAIEINPENAEALCSRGNIYKSLGKIEAAVNSLRESLKYRPLLTTHANLLLTLNYSAAYSADDVFKEHRAFAKQYETIHPKADKTIKSRRAHKKRIRIGYISPDFRRHSVACFLEPVIKNHNREIFRIYCFSNGNTEDDVTRRFQAISDKWRNVHGMLDEEVVKQIQDDNIDILVDLSGHTINNRLPVFACRPAPVQVTWLGYPNTTGLSSIDYRITDELCDPVGLTDRYYTENLIRLPDTFSCFQPFDPFPDIGALPLVRKGHVTFGSFNNRPKITRGVIHAWSKVLHAIPDSELVMKFDGADDELLGNVVHKEFKAQGIEVERLTILPLERCRQKHLERYNQVDICLDTFPYSGTTTTCESLWMGVPVVTLEGDRHVSRVGVSQMTNIGLPFLIAHSRQEYIDIAVKLASDARKLDNLRHGLRDRVALSPLGDAARFTKHLEQAFLDMWRAQETIV